MTLYNTRQWFAEFHKMKIDRLSMLVLVHAITVTLQSGKAQWGTEQLLRSIGRGMTRQLLASGLMMDAETRAAWDSLFK